jgi:hypothetical protein
MPRTTDAVKHAAAASSVELGTLWTVRRGPHTAQCTLLWLPYNWELRVVLNGVTLLSERCRTQDEVVSIARTWRGRMASRGWSPVATSGGTGPGCP